MQAGINLGTVDSKGFRGFGRMRIEKPDPCFSPNCQSIKLVKDFVCPGKFNVMRIFFYPACKYKMPLGVLK